MPVRMMHVRHMRMPVTQANMFVRMGMRLTGWVVRRVPMPMVLIMRMRMRMLQRFVLVIVLMHFGQMQSDAESHEAARHQQPNGYRFVQKQDRSDGADERRSRKIRTCTRGTEVAQSKYEKGEAYAIA